MAHSVDNYSDDKGEEKNGSQEEEQEYSDNDDEEAISYIIGNDEEMSEESTAASKVPGSSATKVAEKKKAVKRHRTVKTKKDRRREALKFRKKYKGKPIEKWSREGLKAVCIYKKQPGDAGVPEKKSDLVALYKIRASRLSPPCSDAEDWDDEEKKEEKGGEQAESKGNDAALVPLEASKKDTMTAASFVVGPEKRGCGEPRKLTRVRQSTVCSQLVEAAKRTNLLLPGSSPQTFKATTTRVSQLSAPSSVPPSPLARVKRGRPEDEDQARRVNQRTEESLAASQEQNEEKSMETLVLDDLNSTDEDALADTLDKLTVILRWKKGEETEDQRKRQDEFIQLGGHATVVRVMNAHLQCMSIQMKGAGVLTNLCTRSNARAREAVGKVRGIQAVVEAMKAHPLEIGVIFNGIAALLNLSSNEANATLLVTKLEAMPFIVDRANHFLADEHVMRFWCSLLSTLCGFIPLRNCILFRAKAAPVLALAVTNYKDNAGLQEVARRAMTKLMSSPS